MSGKKRSLWKFWLVLAVLALLAYQFGGGLWGWGGGSFAAVQSMPEDTPAQLVQKQNALEEFQKNSSAISRPEVDREIIRLREILEAWAEDAYRSAEWRIQELEKANDRAGARTLIENIPKEYFQTSWGPKFAALRENATR